MGPHPFQYNDQTMSAYANCSTIGYTQPVAVIASSQKLTEGDY